ncbi:hypothetical protein IE81DRAFT_320849 [Ceraceosorus guamensis]|uniref:Uncharacterized protein n=1 Tax=Ceraceosorus guamensis TaxID=1522189 RepID=A0A316WB81_9BASI|nr:hypothetical protein IE81DRAFT_320849 [Ceraceosorus guamensis]PWN44875.1 hypothetical protein IE81DRAFT_320849 [Ceraceosorus guamensis]
MPALAGAEISIPYTQAEARSLADLLEPRSPRGGGGGGGGGRGGGSTGSSGSSGSSSSGGGTRGGTSGSSGSSGSSGVRSSTPGFTAGSVSSGSALRGSSSAGGVRTPYTVTSGAFTGRTAGGGTRSNVYSPAGAGYGSGYTSGARGTRAGSTAGLGFPFIYWPLGFGALGAGGYYGASQYRMAGRPGGDEGPFYLSPPAGVDSNSNAFYLYGDNNSVIDTKNALATACGSGNDNATAPADFRVLPTSIVQYYRGSSFALGLIGYNNGQPANDSTGDNGTDDALARSLTVLPSTVNMTYFNCLNNTIGTQLPLVADTQGDGAISLGANSAALTLLPALLVAFLLGAL